MNREQRCPKCDLYLSPVYVHRCRVDLIDAALEGLEVDDLAHHRGMVRWMAQGETETVEWLVALIGRARGTRAPSLVEGSPDADP